MKYILILIAITISLPVFSQVYEIESVTDSTVALKKTEWNADSLQNVTWITEELDSVGMAERLLELIWQERTGQARAVKKEKERLSNATAYNSLVNTFSDSVYFDYSQRLFADDFTAAGILPNYRLRVGTPLYWSKAFVAGSGALIMEVTDDTGGILSPRDLGPIRILSPESLRLVSIDIIGEDVDLFLVRRETGRRTFEGEKADGTTIRLTQILSR